MTYEVIESTHLEFVLIDEIHNILDTSARAEVSDQLKYFAERQVADVLAVSADTRWETRRNLDTPLARMAEASLKRPDRGITAV